MDSEYGGQPSNQLNGNNLSAAELARQKVRAAYSSTVESLKNLPPDAQELLVEQTSQQPPSTTYDAVNQQASYQHQETSYQPAEYQNLSYYNNESQSYDYETPSYQRTPDYHNLTDYSTTLSNSYNSNMATDDYNLNMTHELDQNTVANENDFYKTTSGTLKDTPIDQDAVNEEWQKYHSAWQDYYKNYYSDYYAKAAQTYLATEKMKTERIASGEARRSHSFRRALPLIIFLIVAIGVLFLQYNRMIFAPIMAYISPDTGSVTTNINAIDPTITQTVSPEPRLIIPKLNIDVPVAFGIPYSDVDAAMNEGVAQFAIPGANAMPGQIGNLVITGHSAGDIYSSNPYKFIFSGLERLEVGDLIYVNYESVRYTYQMTRRETVDPTNVAALIYETDKPMLTLITCTPLGTSRYRLLITAEQINPSYDTNNTQTPITDDPNTNDPEMPANEPSFFESIWQGIFGN